MACLEQQLGAASGKRCEQCGQLLGELETDATTCASCLLALVIDELQTEFRAIAPMRHSPGAAELNSLLPQLEFLELLGGGGAGWVYLANQRSLQRTVAVKLLRGQSSGLESADARFQQEAQTLARLSHPRLVTVHDFGMAADEQSGAELGYLVMEYVSGPTLRQKLAAGRLEPAEAVRVARQICEAIDYAHNQGVIHRDLKPENILFVSDDPGADLKVADFGIAKLVGDPDAAPSFTATGTLVGTPYYIAPERHAAGAEATPRGDLFSVGVILYEMLTGAVPVGALESLAERREAPHGLSKVVMQALATEPQRRFASAGEMIVALDHAADQQSDAVPKRSVKFMAALAALALLLAAVVLAPRIIQSEPREPDAPLARQGPQANAQPEPPSPAAGEQAQPEPTEPDLSGEGAENKPAFEGWGVVITSLKVLERRPFEAKLVLDLKVQDPQFIDDDKAELHWVFESRGRQVSGRVPALAGRNEVMIEASLAEGPGAFRGSASLWPAEVHIEERWGGPEGGKRRVSEVFKVQGWHVNPVHSF